MFKKTFLSLCFGFLTFSFYTVFAAPPNGEEFLKALESGSLPQIEAMLSDFSNIKDAEQFTQELSKALEQKYQAKINKKEISKLAEENLQFHKMAKKSPTLKNKAVNRYFLKKAKQKFNLPFSTKKASHKLAKLQDLATDQLAVRSAFILKSFQSFLKQTGFCEELSCEPIEPAFCTPFTEVLTGALLLHVPDARFLKTALYLMSSGATKSMVIASEKV